MTREPPEPLRLDYLIKAGAIHSMTGGTYRSVGVRGPEIVAVSSDPGGLDDLAGAAPRWSMPVISRCCRPSPTRMST